MSTTAESSCGLRWHHLFFRLTIAGLCIAMFFAGKNRTTCEVQSDIDFLFRPMHLPM
jgi:hypothetical protein